MQCIRRNLANALRDHLQSHPSARGTLQSHLDVYTYQRYRARVIPNTRTINHNLNTACNDLRALHTRTNRMRLIMLPAKDSCNCCQAQVTLIV